MNADGKGAVNLTKTSVHEFQPARSQDETRRVFTSQRTGGHDVYVMNVDGSNLVNLTPHPAFDSDPCWTRDGKQVVFGTSRTGSFRLYIVNVDGTGCHELVSKDLRGS